MKKKKVKAKKEIKVSLGEWVHEKSSSEDKSIEPEEGVLERSLAIDSDQTICEIRSDEDTVELHYTNFGASTTGGKFASLYDGDDDLLKIEVHNQKFSLDYGAAADLYLMMLEHYQFQRKSRCLNYRKIKLNQNAVVEEMEKHD